MRKGRKKGRKEGKKEDRKEGRKEEDRRMQLQLSFSPHHKAIGSQGCFSFQPPANEARRHPRR